MPSDPPSAAELQQERQRALGAALCFFSLLAGYYVLRPVREEMGIEGGVRQLQWLYTGTFVSILVVVPLLSWLVARLRRRAAVPTIYALFVLNLLVFWALIDRVGPEARVVLARVIYVWVSVFNMFAISLFWALMADVFSVAGSKRRFGVVAAGGSAGAIGGPLLTAGLAESLGPGPLLLVAAVLLSMATLGIARLGRWAGSEGGDAPGALGGRWWEGATLLLRSPQLRAIAGYIVLFTSVSTFLYFEQANIVEAAVHDEGERTALFAQMDLATNLLALGLQALATAGLIRRFGVALLLLSVPVLSVVGFVALAVAPVLVVLVAVQVLRRAINFALARPAREILFTAVSPAERYKSKLVIDTVVYRGGDMLSAWAFAGLTTLGLGLSAIAAVGIPVAVAWGGVARSLGRRATAARSDAGSAGDGGA
ncbi:MAG: MFS transporter [Myxococcales bacterium]|nr:MFS transporter [Myxococcales bacterium]MCB9718344.1 MFS transporter [Myxococcales bacterium]